jgi:hypothetical protein
LAFEIKMTCIKVSPVRKIIVRTFALVVFLFTSLTPLHLANAVPTGTGLSLYYRSDSAAWTTPPAAFTTSTCHTSTGNINFNWGGGAPGGSCGGDYFTGYGVGYILAPVTGTITFCEQTDDQFYMRIDSSFVINDTSAKAAATGQNCNGTGTMSMVAGTSYPIEIWMHEQGGGAEWRLLWSYAGQSSYVIVPIENLNPTTLTVADTTPPTFTSSSSFSAAENAATSATAATIRVSESATVTISSGTDAARFNISRSDTDTAIIKFNVSPDYEAPIDSGGDNIYNLTLTATDNAGNAGTQSITITVTNVVDTSSFNSLALAGSATTAIFRTSVLITANVSVASKVTFTINGKVLPGCKNRTASGSGSSFSATCNWKPSRRGDVTLTAAATPTGAGITSTTAAPVSIRVGNRTGAR